MAEVIGTFILVFFGLGAVHAAILAGAHSGLWQVAVVWGIAVAVAVYVVAGVSGAHINPAITAALAAWGLFPRREVLHYVGSQLAGGALAGASLFVLFGAFLDAREQERGVVRGEPGSEITAMCYGEYFPSPGAVSTNEKLTTASEVRAALERLQPRVSLAQAMFAEVLGTALLALVVFALTDERNSAAPLARLAPLFIGLTVALLISVIAPLTQACFNPARDFGPRIVAAAAGWGEVALPGPRPVGTFLVYLVSPLAGAILGGGVYLKLLRPAQPVVPPRGSE